MVLVSDVVGLSAPLSELEPELLQDMDQRTAQDASEQGTYDDGVWLLAGGMVIVAAGLVEEPEPEEEPDGVTKENWGDCARMVLSWSALATRFTWKPEPEGQPAEGGLTFAVPAEVTTSASRTCW